MSWKSGADLMDGIIDAVRDTVKDVRERRLLYGKLIRLFERRDCDVLANCLGRDEVFDQAFRVRKAQEGDE